MKIAGLVKSSLIDYPDNIAAVIFTQGCNFRCGFCHNPDLIPANESANLIDEDEVLTFLNGRKGILDGVVITGGEPTIQSDLVEFIQNIKKMGLIVKLDTNGSNPEILLRLIKDGLVDYIAMDIKGPLDKYKDICGYLNTNIVQRSIKIIIDSGLEHEFRTTLLPTFHEMTDMKIIGQLIKGANKYTLQGFRPEITYDKSLNKASSFARTDLQEMAKIISSYVKVVIIHDNL